MRARLALATCSIVFCLGAEAIAAPFCVVSSSGRQCHYYTRSTCEGLARQVDGACVANVEENDSPAASQPPPSRSFEPINPSGVLDSFNRGLDASRQRQYDQDRRALELDRMRMENDAMRNASVSNSKPLTFNEIVIQFLQDGVPQAVAETRLPQEVIDRCERFREFANQNRSIEQQRVFWESVAQYDICLRSGVIPLP